MGKEFPYAYYDRGTFDFETWICALRDQATTSETHSDAEYQCLRARAGRWVLVPLLVVAVGAIGAAMVVTVRTVRREEGESVKLNGMKTLDGSEEETQEGRGERA